MVFEDTVDFAYKWGLFSDRAVKNVSLLGSGWHLARLTATRVDPLPEPRNG